MEPPKTRVLLILHIKEEMEKLLVKKTPKTLKNKRHKDSYAFLYPLSFL